MAEINNFLSPEAEKQVQKYKQDLEDISKDYASIAKSANTLIKAQNNEKKTQEQLTTRQKEALKLQKQLRTAKAKNEQATSTLNKELVKQKITLQEQNKALRDQARQDLGLKKRTTLFKSMTKSLLSAGAAMAVVAGALKLVWKEISRSTEFQLKLEEATNATRAAVDVLTGSLKQAAMGNGGFVDFNKRVQEAIDKSIELTRRTQDLSYEQAVLLATGNKLLILENLYRSVADDATRSFQQRAEFAEKAFEKQQERLEKELELNKEAYEIERDRQRDVRAQGLLLSAEELKTLATFKTAYDNSKAQLKKSDLDYSKFKRELALDDFEQELDFIFDVADKRKTANEKLIADETKTARERVAILGETKKILDESFDDQIDLFESENEIQIDRNKLLKLNNKESFEYARGLGMSERATNRLLEVIRERIAATSDIDEAQKALNKSLQVESIATVELRAVRSKDLTDRIKDELNERYNANKEYLEKVKNDELRYYEVKNELAMNSKDLILDTLNSVYDFQLQSIDNQLDELDNYYQTRINAQSNLGQSTIELETQYNNKRAQLEEERVKKEKQQALINIGVSTAQSAFDITANALTLTSAAALNPLLAPLIPFAWAQLGLLGVASGAQIAAVSQFDEGTGSTPSTYIAGEKRPEFRKHNGEWSLLTEPTLFTDSAGDTIISGAETEQILKGASLQANTGNSAIDSDKIVRAIEQNRSITNIDKRAYTTIQKANGDRDKWLNDRIRN